MSDSKWRDAHLAYPVKGRRDIFDAISILNTLKSPTFVWRGQADSWPLSPRVHRKPSITSDAAVIADQEHLIGEARKRRHDYLDGWEMPDLALLARLQHNGAATLLLDVTTDPYVALYFACEVAKGSEAEDGVLVAIDVSHSRKSAHTVAFDLGHGATIGEVLDALGSKLGLYTPPEVSPRAMAQRSRFLFGAYTSHGYSTLPIARKDWDADKLSKLLAPKRGVGQPPKPAVVALKIPPALKPRLREILDQSFGLNAVTLFPDFHGFAAAHGIG